MKKRLYTTAVLAATLLATTSCSNNTDEGNEPGTRTPLIGYYWCGDEKIEIIINPEKQFVAFEKELEEKIISIQPKCEITQLKIQCIPYEKNSENKLYSGKLYWTTLTRKEAEQLKGDERLYYVGPFYGIESGGKDYPVSNSFFIKLKEESDITILEELAAEKKVEIIGQTTFMPLWWRLSCNTESDGFSIDMANFFYETGLFAASDPDFFGTAHHTGM